MRIGSPYPQRVVKDEYMGRFLEIIVKTVARIDAWKENPTKFLWRWEPDRRFNFFFNPPVHLCVVTYKTEISLHVTLSNQSSSLTHSLTHSQLKLSPIMSWKSVKLTANLSNVYNTYRIEKQCCCLYFDLWHVTWTFCRIHPLFLWVAYVSKLIKINNNAFMAGAASQAGDADSSRAPGLTSIPIISVSYVSHSKNWSIWRFYKRSSIWPLFKGFWLSNTCIF